MVEYRTQRIQRRTKAGGKTQGSPAASRRCNPGLQDATPLVLLGKGSFMKPSIHSFLLFSVCTFPVHSKRLKTVGRASMDSCFPLELNAGVDIPFQGRVSGFAWDRDGEGLHPAIDYGQMIPLLGSWKIVNRLKVCFCTCIYRRPV